MKHESISIHLSPIDSQLNCCNRYKVTKGVLIFRKVFGSVVCDAHDIIFIDKLEKMKTIIKEYYAAILYRLNKENKRAHIKKNVASSRHHTGFHFHERYCEIQWIEVVRNVPLCPVFFRSAYKRLLFVSQLKMIVP